MEIVLTKAVPTKPGNYFISRRYGVFPKLVEVEEIELEDTKKFLVVNNFYGDRSDISIPIDLFKDYSWSEEITGIVFR